jgi:hypothetical protein
VVRQREQQLHAAAADLAAQLKALWELRAHVEPVYRRACRSLIDGLRASECPSRTREAEPSGSNRTEIIDDEAAAVSDSLMPRNMRRLHTSAMRNPLLLAESVALLTSLRLAKLAESAESLACVAASRLEAIAQREAEWTAEREEQLRLMDAQHAELAQQDRLLQNIQRLVADRHDELNAHIDRESARLRAAERSFASRVAHAQTEMSAQKLALHEQHTELKLQDTIQRAIQKQLQSVRCKVIEQMVNVDQSARVATAKSRAEHCSTELVRTRLCAYVAHVQARCHLRTAFVLWRCVCRSVSHRRKCTPIAPTAIDLTACAHGIVGATCRRSAHRLESCDTVPSALNTSPTRGSADRIAHATALHLLEAEPARETKTDGCQPESSRYLGVNLARLTPGQRRLLDRVYHQASSSESASSSDEN